MRQMEGANPLALGYFSGIEYSDAPYVPLLVCHVARPAHLTSNRKRTVAAASFLGRSDGTGRSREREHNTSPQEPCPSGKRALRGFR